MYSPINPDPCMPAVPPLYPMYPMEPPYMPEPTPIYPPNNPMCPENPYMPEPTPMYPYPMEPPCMPEPKPMPYPPTEMPYMCPLMRDPMVRHCVELCLKRCRGSLYTGEFPMEINEIGNLSHEIEEIFTSQNPDEIV